MIDFETVRENVAQKIQALMLEIQTLRADIPLAAQDRDAAHAIYRQLQGRVENILPQFPGGIAPEIFEVVKAAQSQARAALTAHKSATAQLDYALDRLAGLQMTMAQLDAIAPMPTAGGSTPETNVEAA